MCSKLNELVSVYPFYNYVMIAAPDGEVLAINSRDSQGRAIEGEMLLGLDFRENPLFPKVSVEQTTEGDPGADPFLPILEIDKGISQWFVTQIGKKEFHTGWVVVSYDWESQLSALLRDIIRQLVTVGNPVLEAILTDRHGNIVVDSSHAARTEERGHPARGTASRAEGSERKLVPSPNKLWRGIEVTFGKTAMQIGLFYLAEQTEDGKLCLVLTTSYAFERRLHLANKFRLGEGLAGQAALEKKSISITEPGEQDSLIRQESKKTGPPVLLAIPFLHEKTVKGVIELGFLKMPTEIQRAFLEQSMEGIAIAINSAESRARTEALIHKSDIPH
ncbi:MAG: GAF domain-containing protein [Gammaproteobacteria bacterium]|nr:GAF domain-containing protein [Gammaproteobacteria bacterium]